MIPTATVNNEQAQLEKLNHYDNNNEDEDISNHSTDNENHSRFQNQPPIHIIDNNMSDDDLNQSKTNANFNRYKTFKINKSNHINQHIQSNNTSNHHHHFEQQLTVNNSSNKENLNSLNNDEEDNENYLDIDTDEQEDDEEQIDFNHIIDTENTVASLSLAILVNNKNNINNNINNRNHKSASIYIKDNHTDNVEQQTLIKMDNSHLNTNANNNNHYCSNNKLHATNNNQNHSDHSHHIQHQNQNHPQHQHFKLNKDLNKEERLRLVKEKREQEIEKRKKEIEENLKRKQELRDKQLKERQKRIDELKLRENEKRLAVEERRRQREESARIRLNELVKREQEREKQARLAHKLNNLNAANNHNNKGSEWILSSALSSATNSETNAIVNSINNNNDQMSSSTTINKSQSAYNLNLNHLLTNNNSNKKKDIFLTTSVYATSGLSNETSANNSKRINSTQLRLSSNPSSASSSVGASSLKNQDTKASNAALNSINESSSALLKRLNHNDLIDINNNSSASDNKTSKRRSRTVPTTPKHSHCQNSADDSKMIKNNSNNNHIQSNSTTSNNMNKSLYWEGPPAHFMLPTHADHCRSSRSVERCPRASKVLSDTLEALANEQQSQKPLTTITERKPLPPHLQQFVNRLSTPKKLNDDSTTSLSISQRALTPQPNEHNNNCHINHNPEIQSNTTITTATIRKSSTPHFHCNNSGNSTSNSHKPMKAFALNGNDSVSLTSGKTASVTNETFNDFAKPTASTQLKKSLSKNAISANETSSVSTPTPIRKHSNNTTNKSDLKVIGTLQAAKTSAFIQSSSNSNIVNLTNGFNSNNLVNSKKTNSSSNTTLSQQHKQKQQKQTKSADTAQPKSEPLKPFTMPVSESSSQSNGISTDLAIDQSQPVNDEKVNIISQDFQETESYKLEEEYNCSSNSVSVTNEAMLTNPNTLDEASTQVLAPAINVATVPAPIIQAKISILSQEEEEYKKKLEEKRREAREKAAKEAEIERQRQEAIRVEEEKRKKEEEELERIAEEEQLRLHQLAREQEEERLRLAIEQNERIENERRLKEELEKKQKEENDRKAKEDAERIERERLEKNKKEEEERLERKKKVDMIMRRVHKEDSSQTNLSNSTGLNNSNGNLLLTISNTDLTNASMNGSMISSSNNPHTPISMTTSMITTTSSSNEITNDQQRFKAPLLQSILSKTRITNILNKYADDPILSSSTLSMMAAQNKDQANKFNKVQQLTKADIFPNEKTEKVSPVNKEIKENSNKRVSLNSDNDEIYNKQQQSDDDFADANKIRFDLQLNEVEVVVDTSSPSSSPSSPTSSTSSNTSLNENENDHVNNSKEQQPTTPSQTQISA